MTFNISIWVTEVEFIGKKKILNGISVSRETPGWNQSQGRGATRESGSELNPNRRQTRKPLRRTLDQTTGEQPRSAGYETADERWWQSSHRSQPVTRPVN